MNILYIDHYAGSVRHGMEFRPYYMAREWTRLGHTVTILAADYSHLRRENPVITKDFTTEFVDGIPYTWVKTSPYHGNGPGRARNILQFVEKVNRRAETLAQELSPDAVIASSTYPFDIYPARNIARRRGAVLVYEIHDLWPMTPMVLGNLPPWNPVMAVMQKAEDAAFRDADRVISLLPAANRHMEERAFKTGVGKEQIEKKFSYIPNGVMPEEVGATLPKQHTELLSQLRREDKFILLYAGGHARSNDLFNLLRSAKLLDDSFATVLAGDGIEKPSLQLQVKKDGMKNVYFLPSVEKRCVPALLEKADALYFGAKKCRLYAYGMSPNKLYDYMLAAKPVIYAVEAANDPVGTSGCGLSVAASDPKAVAEAVKRLRDTPVEERIKMGEQGRAYVLKHHNYPMLAQRFLSAIYKEGR